MANMHAYGGGPPQGRPSGRKPRWLWPVVLVAISLQAGGFAWCVHSSAADQKRRHVQEALDQEDAQAQRSADIADAQAQTDRAAASRLTKYQAMSPAQRFAAIRGTCDSGECDRDEEDSILAATATPDERTKVDAEIARRQKEAAALEAKEEAAQDIKDRHTFAEKYEQQLFERGLNPQGVSATGSDATTLRMIGAFCSRQFLYDFQGPDSRLAKAVGFKKVECVSPFGTLTTLPLN